MNWVNKRDGELLGSAYSDGGIAIIPIGPSSNIPGEVDLVVTYYNAYTYDESLMISELVDALRKVLHE